MCVRIVDATTVPREAQLTAELHNGAMLFREDVLRGIADGRVTLAFRRWRRAPPAAGSTLRTPVGVLTLDRVTVVDGGGHHPGRRQPHRHVGRCAAGRRSPATGALLRVELRLLGDDPRIALREQRPVRRRRSPRSSPASGRLDASADARRGPCQLPATDCRPAGRRWRACSPRQAGAELIVVQAARPAAEGARPHREPRGGLPDLAARRRSARRALRLLTRSTATPAPLVVRDVFRARDPRIPVRERAARIQLPAPHVQLVEGRLGRSDWGRS